MARLLLILLLLQGVSCVEADGTKTASVKNRDPSIHMADLQPLKIDRHFPSCLPSDSICVLKCSAFNVQEANLTWFKEKQVCSQVSVIDLNPNPSLHLEVKYQDKSNYSCVLNNPISGQSLYANIAQLCEPCPDITQTELTVKEGDSVTLHTNLKDTQKNIHILWMFGPNKIVNAEKSNNNMHINDCPDGRFRGRLQLDIQTGDLTITNTSKTDSDIYKLQIKNESSTCWSFNVTVSEHLPSPQISNYSNHCPSSGSKCVVECSVENVTEVNLTWYKGNTLLSNIIVSRVNYLCLKLDYKDKSNYSCVVSNSLINETEYLIISEVCSDHSNNLALIICLAVGGVIVAAVIVAVVVYTHIQRQKRQKRRKELENILALIICLGLVLGVGVGIVAAVIFVVCKCIQSQKEAASQIVTRQNSSQEAFRDSTSYNTANDQQPLIDSSTTDTSQAIPLSNLCRK